MCEFSKKKIVTLVTLFSSFVTLHYVGFFCFPKLDFPTNIGITRCTPSVAILVVASDGGQHWGCPKVVLSLMYRLYGVSTPGQVLE